MITQKENIAKRLWAEVDLGAIRHNYNEIRACLKPETKLCCIIKANAYGHGEEAVASFYEEIGADYFAVSNLEEALHIREAGVRTPILILGFTRADLAVVLAEQNITQCLFSEDYAKKLSACAVAHGVQVKVHIKVDSGMSRIGFRSAEEAWPACSLPGLAYEGIFTHFASADEGDGGEAFTRGQYERFMSVVTGLEARGMHFTIRHCCNSAGIMDFPEYQLDMVRAGIILYGIDPSGEVRHHLDLIPAMTLRSVVSMVKTIHAGDVVSYGRRFKAEHDMVLATIPVGYADGFFRANFRNGTKIWVNGVPCPICGTVCMDQLMVDASAVPHLVEGGSEVVIFGRAPYPTAETLAEANGTIPYEILCAVGARVPRVFV